MSESSGLKLNTTEPSRWGGRKEKRKPVRHPFAASFIAFGTALLFSRLLVGSFSEATRRKIIERDHGTCCDCDRSFRQGWMVQAAHRVHSKEDMELYDSPDNGRVLCLEHHFLETLALGDRYGAQALAEMIWERGFHTDDFMAGLGEWQREATMYSDRMELLNILDKYDTERFVTLPMGCGSWDVGPANL